jgi:hypothetical protein
MAKEAIAMNQIIGMTNFGFRHFGLRRRGYTTTKKRTKAIATILSIETVKDTSRMNGVNLHITKPSFHSAERASCCCKEGGMTKTTYVRSEIAMLKIKQFAVFLIRFFLMKMAKRLVFPSNEKTASSKQ